METEDMPNLSARPPITSEALTAIPAASPYILYSRLNALVIPTIQRYVNGIASQNGQEELSINPFPINIEAAKNCIKNFVMGFISIRSSQKPATNIIDAPMATMRYSNGWNNRNVSINETNTAIPPIKATYRVFQRSSRGTDIHFNFTAAFRTK